MATEDLFIGLMSGTSLDGVDGVLVSFSPETARPRVLAHVHLAFGTLLLEELHALQVPAHNELHRAAMASIELARTYAACVTSLLASSGEHRSQVHAIGVHGQTVRHQPSQGYTIQLNAPAVLAELTGIDVIADFRSRDLAAAGQGAPLVPAFHADIFGADDPLAIVNIGGIANLTGIPGRGATAPVIGFDCGPGNVLMDAWSRLHGKGNYDPGGAWAASGQLIPGLLSAMLAAPYFRQAPPKSTGRDLFDLNWLRSHAGVLDHPPEDVQFTLAELSAASIGQAIEANWADAQAIYVCGGGAFNDHLMQRLAMHCRQPVLGTQTLGVPPDQVEALAFAWLARQFAHRLPGNLPSVTGARGTRVLGALYPA